MVEVGVVVAELPPRALVAEKPPRAAARAGRVPRPRARRARRLGEPEGVRREALEPVLAVVDAHRLALVVRQTPDPHARPSVAKRLVEIRALLRREFLHAHDVETAVVDHLDDIREAVRPVARAGIGRTRAADVERGEVECVFLVATLRDAVVDVLPAVVLIRDRGDHVVADLERLCGGGGHLPLFVVARIAVEVAGQHAIEPHLRVIVVVQRKERLGGHGVESHVAAQPDVLRIPLRADRRAGRAGRTESTRARLPP